MLRVVCRLGDIQPLPDVALDIVVFSSYLDGFVVIIPGQVDDTLDCSVTKQAALVIALRVLPRILDDEYGILIAFAVCSPAGRSSAGDTACAFHHLVEDKPLSRTMPLDLDKPLVICHHDCRVKPELFLALQRKPRIVETNYSPSLLMSNCSEAMPPSRSNTHTLIREPHRVKPRTNRRLSWAPSTSRAYLARSSRASEGVSADGLLFSSPGTRICTQLNRGASPVLALGLSTKPISIFRFPTEPEIGSSGFASRLRRRVGVDWWRSAKTASLSQKPANQLSTSSCFAPSGHPLQPPSKDGLLPSKHSSKKVFDAVARFGTEPKYAL